MTSKTCVTDIQKRMQLVQKNACVVYAKTHVTSRQKRITICYINVGAYIYIEDRVKIAIASTFHLVVRGRPTRVRFAFILCG